MADITIRKGEQIDLSILSDDQTIEVLPSRSTEPITLGIEEKHGTSDYNMLTGKPSINGVTVQGDKIGEDYKLQDRMHTLSPSEIEKILYLG